jgi:hypothetical protein
MSAGSNSAPASTTSPRCCASTPVTNAECGVRILRGGRGSRGQVLTQQKINTHPVCRSQNLQRTVENLAAVLVAGEHVRIKKWMP